MAPYVLRLGDVNSVVFLRSIHSQASVILPRIQHLTSVDAVHQLLTDKCNVAGHVDMLAVLMLSSQIAAMQSPLTYHTEDVAAFSHNPTLIPQTRGVTVSTACCCVFTGLRLTWSTVQSSNPDRPVKQQNYPQVIKAVHQNKTCLVFTRNDF